MGVLVPFVIVGSVVGATVCVGLAAVAWHYREVPAAPTFGALVLATAAWSFANAALITSDTVSAAYVSERLVRATVVQIPPLWLVFVLVYVGNEEWVTPGRILALWTFPIVFVGLSVTAPLHGLASTPDDVVMLTTGGITAPYVPVGVLYLPLLVFAIGAFGAGFLVLIRYLIRSRSVYRKQTAVLVLGGFLAMVTAIVSQIGVLAHPGIDVTPISFMILGTSIGWALLRYDFLQLMPLAEDVLIDELPDPVFVLGTDDRVIDFNPAAVDVIDRDDLAGMALEDVAPGLSGHLGDGQVFRRANDRSGDGLPTYYQPNVTPLEDQYGTERGHLVVLRDITGQQRRQERLEALQEATRRFLGASTDQEIAAITVEYAERTIACEAAGVFLVDDERALQPAATSDNATELFEREELVVAPDDGYAAYRAYESGEAVEIGLESDVGGPIQRLTFLPLGDLGILAAGTTNAEGFDAGDVGFATILARTSHVALTRTARERELRRSRKALERRTEQIAFFNGVLRHSLRNALLVIEGRAEHVRESLPDDETEHVDTIVGWCSDLGNLNEEIRSVNDTVTASESERLDVVDLSSLLRDRVDAYEERYPDASFDVDVDDGLRIEANELVRSVVDNVVDNAVVHNDGETPRVDVWTATAADRAQVHVADDGPGITDEMKSIVFQRAVTTDQTASGFGLHFVSVLMNLYGGNLRFEDNDPRGTIAVLEFQLADPDTGTQEEGAAHEAGDEGGASRVANGAGDYGGADEGFEVVDRSPDAAGDGEDGTDGFGH